MELGTTVIIIEHRLEEVFPMADKVLVLEDGRQLFYDEPRKVGTGLAGNDLFLQCQVRYRFMMEQVSRGCVLSRYVRAGIGFRKILGMCQTLMDQMGHV